MRYEILTEEMDTFVECIGDYPRYEMERFYAIIEAPTRSAAKYRAMRMMKLSDFRDLPKMSIKKIGDDRGYDPDQ